MNNYFLIAVIFLWANHTYPQENYLSHISLRMNGDYKNWNAPISHALRNLLDNSPLLYSFIGSNRLEDKFSIVSNNNFNVKIFMPGRQIVIYTGTLDAIDNYSEIKLKESNIACEVLRECREKLIAAALAHELSHLYLGHFQKTEILQSNTSEIGDRQSKFRDMEKEADQYGYILYRQNGKYDQSSYIEFFKLLKRFDQNLNKDLENRRDPYTSSHPSINERLKDLETNNRYYQWAYNMENVFVNIRKGKELDDSQKNVEESLKKFKTNIELLSARAVILHKKWLTTCHPGDLKLKSIVDIPFFSDDPEFLTTKGSSKIPGEEQAYLAAVSAYQIVLEKSNEPFLKSNYASLLVYNPEKHLEAIQLAEEANENSPLLSNLSFHTLNNLGVVYYISGHKEKAEVIFYYMCKKYSLLKLFHKEPSNISLDKSINFNDYIEKLEPQDKYLNQSTISLNYYLIQIYEKRITDFDIYEKSIHPNNNWFRFTLELIKSKR